MLMRNNSSSPTDSLGPEVYPGSEETGGISGRWVILGILILAVGATAFEWNYTRLYRAPFIPLREAIAESFGRTAKVKVDGGRNKQKQMMLRIVIDVPFDPTAESEQKQAVQFLERLEKLAVDNVDLKDYEFLQIHLVHIVPEGNPKQLEHRRLASDVLAGKPIALTKSNTDSTSTPASSQ